MTREQIQEWLIEWFMDQRPRSHHLRVRAASPQHALVELFFDMEDLAEFLYAKMQDGTDV